MNAIEIGGDRYIKATDAAALTGYATDYIGQLSRGKKISAERVGRTWYVSEREIIAHKKGTKRSNKQKTHEALKHQIAEHGQIHHAYFDPKQEGIMPEYRKRLLAAEVRYGDDESPLKPTLNEKSRLDEISPIEIDTKNLGNESEEADPNLQSEAEVEAEPDSELEDAVEEKNADDAQPVVITQIPRALADERSPVRVSHESKPRTQKPKTISHIPLKEMHPVPYGTPSYALMVPVAGYVASLLLLFAFMASLGGIFIEKVMVYEQGERLNSAPHYESSYGMRAVSAVIESLPR